MKTTTIPLGSKLTFQETNAFVSKIQSAVAEGAGKIEVNMADCRYLNSIMLSGLIRALKHCKSHDCQMVLVEVDTSARTLFQTTNVDSLFTISASQSEPKHRDELNTRYEPIKESYGLLTVSGSLNTGEQCAKFREAYEKKTGGITHCVLECTGLEHLSTSGVTELFRLRGILQEKNGKLILVSESESVESVWKMMHLDSLIPKVSSVEKALAKI